jgi:hypothetical protein
MYPMLFSVKPTTQQSTYLLWTQGVLLLTARMRIFTLAPQSPAQAMITNNQIIQAIAVDIACTGD